MIRPRTCPICDRELPTTIQGDSALFPFCSLRCKQVDLFHWFHGDYVITEALTPEGQAEDLPPGDGPDGRQH